MHFTTMLLTYHIYHHLAIINYFISHSLVSDADLLEIVKNFLLNMH